MSSDELMLDRLEAAVTQEIAADVLLAAVEDGELAVEEIEREARQGNDTARLLLVRLESY